MTLSFEVRYSFTYVVHDSFFFDVLRDSFSYVVQDSFFFDLRQVAFIQVRLIQNSDTVNDSFMSLTSIMCICGMTHLCVRHEIGTQEIHPYPGHDSFWCWALRVEFLFL